jgi:hypothetical protein
VADGAGGPLPGAAKNAAGKQGPAGK